MSPELGGVRGIRCRVSDDFIVAQRITPEDLGEARRELIDLLGKYNPVQRLETYSDALNYMEHTGKDDHFFILHLKPKENQLIVNSFRKNESQLANSRYLSIEENIVPASEEEAVLVSVDSVASLKKAYPNYFLDTKAFANEVGRVERLAKRN